MKKESLAALTVSLTDACNFRCSYCYQESYTSRPSLERQTLDAALDFFFPYLQKDAHVIFYGGEPLLRLDEMRHAVEVLVRKQGNRRRRLRWSLTTNGSLLDEPAISFLEAHRFSVTLSFDGAAQEAQRGPGSHGLLRSKIAGLLARPGIRLETNSVFTPASVRLLSSSLKEIVGLGLAEANFSLSFIEPWKEADLQILSAELRELGDFLLAEWRRRRAFPVAHFRPASREGVFACYAGRDRLALAADGTVWGCALFHDLFKEKRGDEDYRRYCFGRLPDLIAGRGRGWRGVQRHYAGLRQDGCHTDEDFCHECENLRRCRVCPVQSGLAGSPLLDKVPLDLCRAQRILTASVREFQEKVKHDGRAAPQDSQG